MTPGKSKCSRSTHHRYGVCHQPSALLNRAQAPTRAARFCFHGDATLGGAGGSRRDDARRGGRPLRASATSATPASGRRASREQAPSSVCTPASRTAKGFYRFEHYFQELGAECFSRQNSDAVSEGSTESKPCVVLQERCGEPGRPEAVSVEQRKSRFTVGQPRPRGRDARDETQRGRRSGPCSTHPAVTCGRSSHVGVSRDNMRSRNTLHPDEGQETPRGAGEDEKK